jgi:hypothetical protein
VKAIFGRLRRLERITTPDRREQAAAEAILENRRRRLGSDYEPIEYPTDWFAGCHGAAGTRERRSVQAE